MNKVIFSTIIILIIIAGVLSAVRLVTPEDLWVCVDGAWVMHGKPNDPKPINGCEGEKILVRIGQSEIFATEAISLEEKQVGLSGQLLLPEDEGMLFVFSMPGKYNFWMPDMNFPIDIIWIGADKTIVDISKNVQPLTDYTNPIRYSSILPAQYVLEVNAGFTDNHDIKIGDTVSF